MTGCLNDLQALQLRRLLEGGLPLAARPYQRLAEQIGSVEERVLEQIQRWQEEGLFRRFGDRYGFDHLMLAAQGYQESRLDHSARSEAGASAYRTMVARIFTAARTVPETVPLTLLRPMRRR